MVCGESKGLGEAEMPCSDTRIVKIYFDFCSEVKPFDEIIKVVKDIKRIDLSKLDGIVEWFDELLHKYQNLTGFSDTRINRLCILLNRQINKLKKLQENS